MTVRAKRYADRARAQRKLDTTTSIDRRPSYGRDLDGVSKSRANGRYHLGEMSGYRLLLIPEDPARVPSEAARAEAKKLLADALARAEEISDRVADEIEAVFPDDVGAIHCPECRAEIDRAWWQDAIAVARSKQFRNLRAKTPCCHATVSLQDLAYAKGGGFARYSIAISNPNVSDLPAQLRRAVARALGGAVRGGWLRD